MGKIVDHTGERFGSLVAVQRLPKYSKNQTYYKCVCDCGSEKIVLSSNLTNKHTTSCGCYRKTKRTNELMPHIGTKINSLTITDVYVDKEARFMVKCDCGEIFPVYANAFLAGTIFACKKCSPPKLGRKRKNIVGLKFGMLTVTEMLYRHRGHLTYCRCSCECGNETIVGLSNLTNGNTSSCGCLGILSRYKTDHSKDYTGLRVGDITFLEKTSIKESNGSIKWKCLCDCGNIFLATRSYASTHRTCGCEYDDVKNLNLVGDRYGALVVDEKLEPKYRTSAWFACSCDCGNKVNVRAKDLIQGRRSSCGCGSTSAFEELVATVLDEFGFTYVREKTFDGCVYISKLRFDFYIEEHNLLIEADGPQHYMPIQNFGGKETYEQCVIRDSIKNHYCKTNNIRLLRITYSRNKQDIQQQIINYINPVTITA